MFKDVFILGHKFKWIFEGWHYITKENKIINRIKVIQGRPCFRDFVSHGYSVKGILCYTDYQSRDIAFTGISRAGAL